MLSLSTTQTAEPARHHMDVNPVPTTLPIFGNQPMNASPITRELERRRAQNTSV